MSTVAGGKEPECQASEGWLRSLVGSIRESLAEIVNKVPLRGNELDLREDVGRLYSAALAADFDAACRTSDGLSSADSWHNVVSVVVEQIEANWRSDKLTLFHVIDAFWTIKRVIDYRDLQIGEAAHGDIAHAKVAIFVPPTDEHSFGARLLGDRLRQKGANVSILVQKKKIELFELLESEHFALLALSASYDLSLQGLAELIQEARVVSTNPRLKVIVGGQVFAGEPDAYNFLNADFVFHPNAEVVSTILSILDLQNAPGDHKHA